MFIDPYLANVTVFAGNFAPRSWAFCNGQLLSIAENTALFSLIGTIYGGDGVTTFALPDLRSRIAVHPGVSGPVLGQQGGTESVTITINNMPAHTHQILSLTGSPPATNATGGSSSPVAAVPAKPGSGLYNTSADGFGLGGSTVLTSSPFAGASLPVAIISPCLAMNYIIAVEGIFPSRN